MLWEMNNVVAANDWPFIHFKKASYLLQLIIKVGEDGVFTFYNRKYGL